MRLVQFAFPTFLSPHELTMISLVLLWLLVAGAVAALALRRFALSWHDHLILNAHPANFDFEHLKLRCRIGAVDRWGQALTIAVVAYCIGLILLVAYQIVDEVIRKLVQLIRLL